MQPIATDRVVLVVYCSLFVCLQCFDAVGLAAGRASACKKLSREGAGVVVCLERGADLHMAQLMPLPLTVSCSSKIQTGYTFLVPAHPGSPRKRAVKRVCVFVSAGDDCECEPYKTEEPIEMQFRRGLVAA